jgi:hypothetical protein
MTTATVLPELSVSFAQRTTAAFETANLDEMTPGEVARNVELLSALRQVLRLARHSIEEVLSRGVDAGEFAAKYERAVSDLGPLAEALGRVVAKTQAKLAPAHAKELGSHFQALAADIANHRQFFATAVAKAKAPPRPIDWQRVQEAEAAYARGETKPFQQSSAPKN